jgi:hypothetical protein
MLSPAANASLNNTLVLIPLVIDIVTSQGAAGFCGTIAKLIEACTATPLPDNPATV